MFKEICGDHGRVMWFKTRDEADLIGITDESIICDPYKASLIQFSAFYLINLILCFAKFVSNSFSIISFL